MGMFDKLAFALGLKKREASVLVIGLDNSGKSTMLNHFKAEDQKSTEIVPTVGFNVEKFKGECVCVCVCLVGNERGVIAQLAARQDL